MRRIFIFLLLPALAGISSLEAQEDLSTHFLRHTWQANRTNPAFFPEHRFVIGLPGLYNNLRVTNITYADLVVQGAGDEKQFDFDGAIAKLGAENIIRENLDVETLSLGFRLGRLFLSLGHTARFNAYLNYPKTLPQLIWQGNAQFIGQEVDFGPQVDLFGYQEIALGLAGQISPNLSIGGRAKLLAGIGNVHTERNNLRLRTDSDIYQLALTADYLVNSTGSLDYDGFDRLAVDFDFGAFNLGQLSSSNTGVAFDLGLHLRLGRLDLAASVLDLGNIRWQEGARNYSLQGVYEYEGLDLAQNILEDSTSLGSVLDSIRSIYAVVETSNTYQTALPSRYYLSATFRLNDKVQLGGLFYGERYLEQFTPALALAGNIDLLPFLNVGASYAFRSNRYDNLGLNATVKLGPVQILAATDNIITAFSPKNAHSANLRLGANLLFGKNSADNQTEGQRTFY